MKITQKIKGAVSVVKATPSAVFNVLSGKKGKSTAFEGYIAAGGLGVMGTAIGVAVTTGPIGVSALLAGAMLATTTSAVMGVHDKVKKHDQQKGPSA